ncbi:MAG: T9SS type A sorting domain-containing protein [Chitinophagales bacterium]
MKHILFFILFSQILLGQETYFNKYYDVENGRQTVKSLVAFEDAYFILGINRVNGDENKYAIWEIDEIGNVVNLNEYGTSNHVYLEGHLISVHNKLFVFFSQFDTLLNSKYFLASIDKKGKLLWEQTYDLGEFNEGSRKLTATKDNGFIMTGFSTSFPNELGQAFCVKTDSIGNMEWQKDYGKLDGHDQGNEIIQTEDGAYLVLAWTSKEFSNRDVWLFKIDSLGNMLWEKKYGGFYFEECTDILEVEDGYVLVGYQYQSPMLDEGSRAYILKIDKEGNLLWEKTYTGVSEYYGTRLDDIFREVRELEDGSLAVIGHSRNYNELERFSGTLMKLTAEGDSLWTKIYHNNSSNHYLWDFEVTEDNGFVMCGWSKGVESGTQDGWVLKLDSLGNTCQPANCDSIFTTSIHYDITTHYPTQFYPNPAQNRVTFQHRLPKGKEAVLEVYDLKGRIMGYWVLDIGDGELVLDIEGWGSGLYLYRVSVEEKEVSSGKLVVE